MLLLPDLRLRRTFAFLRWVQLLGRDRILVIARSSALWSEPEMTFNGIIACWDTFLQWLLTGCSGT